MSDTDFKDFMKLYNDYTKKPHSFLVNDTTLSSDNPLQFRPYYTNEYKWENQSNQKQNRAKQILIWFRQTNCYDFSIIISNS